MHRVAPSRIGGVDGGAFGPFDPVARIGPLVGADLIELDLGCVAIGEEGHEVAVLRERHDLGVVPLPVLLVDCLAFLTDRVSPQLLISDGGRRSFHLNQSEEAAKRSGVCFGVGW